MLSEQQYYEAKVFLNAYKDALNTLDQAAADRAEVQKNKALESHLVNTAKAGQIHVDNHGLREGTFFSESRIRKLGLYHKNLFATSFNGLEAARSTADLKSILESYL